MMKLAATKSKLVLKLFFHRILPIATRIFGINLKTLIPNAFRRKKLPPVRVSRIFLLAAERVFVLAITSH
jgi:hypothetical protein